MIDGEGHMNIGGAGMDFYPASPPWNEYLVYSTSNDYDIENGGQTWDWLGGPFPVPLNIEYGNGKSWLVETGDKSGDNFCVIYYFRQEQRKL